MYFFLKYIVTLFYKKLRIKIVVCLLRDSGPCRLAQRAIEPKEEKNKTGKPKIVRFLKNIEVGSVLIKISNFFVSFFYSFFVSFSIRC